MYIWAFASTSKYIFCAICCGFNKIYGIIVLWFMKFEPALHRIVVEIFGQLRLLVTDSILSQLLLSKSKVVCQILLCFNPLLKLIKDLSYKERMFSWTPFLKWKGMFLCLITQPEIKILLIAVCRTSFTRIPNSLTFTQHLCVFVQKYLHLLSITCDCFRCALHC